VKPSDDTGPSSPDGRQPARASALILLWLNGLPRWLLGLVLIAVTVAGLILSGWPGAILLGLIAVFLAWLASLSWPRADAAGRVLRVLAVVLVVGAAVNRLRN